VTPGIARAQEISVLALQNSLIFGTREQFQAALALIGARADPDLAASVITAMRFSQVPPEPFAEVLTQITGEEGRTTWFDWMVWQESHPEIKPHPSYAEFKRSIFLQIDPAFADFLKPDYLKPDAMGIRLEEITWGGVRKDGIPSLDNPTLIPASEAAYLKDDDLVFGVSINGDARAYPLRIMGWHEMFNDVIGGVPVALAYCTLCGSGILFETRLPGREKPFVFGSSGFLYRSNKLMFDRETNSLWNQFTGRPVVGPLTETSLELQQRPVVITTWAEWRAANPDTRALSLETGFQRDYGSGEVYKEYFASQDLMFPARVDETQHRQKEYVFGIREFGGAKAWPIAAFEGGRVLNDTIHDRPLVLIGDASRRSVRAYEAGDLTFEAQGDGLVDNTGAVWEITEEALGSNGKTLPRVAGHIAFWFAWNGYLGAESELYSD
jgi:hypothetical protein